VVFQSQRMAAYTAALDQLRERRLLYRCFRTRAEVAAAIGQAPHGPETPFFGEPLSASEEAARLARGAPFAWRLSIPAAEDALGGFSGLTFVDAERGRIAADPWAAGDAVLARKDLGVAYHLAVVVDDAAQGVTLVTRGEDLLDACHIQRLLQALLGLPAPRYHHHRLILGPDGKRLAKRDKSETLRSLRAGGMTPQQLRADLGL
jgi:glutamyl-Q tRNA(Asp) synthetase